MRCVICKNGELINGEATITLEKGDATIVFKNVPAKVCSNCGEKYIKEDITKELLLKANELVLNGTQVKIRRFVA